MEIILQEEIKFNDEKIFEKMKVAVRYALTMEGIELDDSGRLLRQNIDEEMSENSDIEVSLSFVDEKEIKELNKEFRNIDKVTDVLSFPQFENIESIKSFIECMKDMPVELGDVVICIDVAKRQAAEYGHSFERELVYLFVHSILHLLGYDHIDDCDRELMRAKEKDIMEKINLKR